MGELISSAKLLTEVEAGGYRRAFYHWGYRRAYYARPYYGWGYRRAYYARPYCPR